jgi:DNA helicase II / ATP-dependent DNA helicase PcrA
MQSGPTPAQQAVAAHREGALLVLGAAGTGRSEALALRLGSLVADGVAADGILVVTRSRAAASRLRARAEAVIDGPYAELMVETYPSLAERLLREHAVEAGLDPFFGTVELPDRLAMLLERVDELPLRRHEIRGNPSGLLARLLRRVDLLKAEGVTPIRLREWAEREVEAATGSAARERASRELEFAEFFARHDRVLRGDGTLGQGDLVLELGRLLRDRPDVRETLHERFPWVMADELEDAGVAHRELLAALSPGLGPVCACDHRQGVRRFRCAGEGTVAWFAERYPDAAEIELDAPLRFGPAAAAAAAIASGDGPPPVERAEEGEVRFWRCATERAQAQAAAREVEQLLGSGGCPPERVCVIAAAGWREARLVGAALEERNVPFRYAGDAAFFQRREVRDALAWLRMLADPSDSAAVVRALTRPPVDLRSVDLARVTTIARRRKLDMISALQAALESPQLPPEARDRIHAFLRLYQAAAGALEDRRADVFVRRLIERIGLRRHRLFAASPETAERLVNLSRLADIAAAWSRRRPQGSTRDFIRHLTAVADAGELGGDDPEPPGPGTVLVAEPEQVKGLEFDHTYVLGLHRGAIDGHGYEDEWVPAELVGDPVPEAGEGLIALRRSRLAYIAMTRARSGLVLSWSETIDDQPAHASPLLEAVREALGGEEAVHAEELFGPAEGLHSTYRMVRDEVLEASWRAGSAVSEMRLDTAEDVNRAVARFLELVKLAALVQRPGSEAAAEALGDVNELLARVATPEQRAALEASALDDYVLGEERGREERAAKAKSAHEPSLDKFIPRKDDGLALSASDIDLYRICPLRYKFARVFAIPQEPTINQRFGILIHQVLDRFHSEEMRSAEAGLAGDAALAGDEVGRGGLDRLLALFEGGWRRAGFGASDDELQYRDRAVAALTRYHERHVRSEARPVWLERSFNFRIGPHRLRGRVDRVDRTSGGGYELIDYKTGERRSGVSPTGDVQIALYRLGAREAWQIEADAGSYWYVLDDERVQVPSQPDDAERVERTVLEVAGGIEGQDFEPRPSHQVCSWCDYRLICPASEA